MKLGVERPPAVITNLLHAWTNASACQLEWRLVLHIGTTESLIASCSDVSLSHFVILHYLIHFRSLSVGSFPTSINSVGLFTLISEDIAVCSCKLLFCIHDYYRNRRLSEERWENNITVSIRGRKRLFLWLLCFVIINGLGAMMLLAVSLYYWKCDWPEMVWLDFRHSVMMNRLHY